MSLARSVLLVVLAATSGCGASSSSSADNADGAPASGDDAGMHPPPSDAGAPGADAGGPTGGHDAATSDSGHVVPPADAQPDVATEAGTLRTGVAPGGNFDLSLWELQEPVGSPGSPTTIPPSKLVGPQGYQDTYFFTDPNDGAMTFWDPENGVTTPNSNYPRSELREMTASGAAADWPIAGTHTLSATLKVTQVPDHVCVGQIHLGTGTPASTKPLLELFYFATGKITLGIEQTPAGGNEVQHDVGTATLGATFSYVIALKGGAIELTLDGGAPQTFAVSSTFAQENMYFKAGDYDQSVGTSASVGAKVQFYALGVTHGP